MPHPDDQKIHEEVIEHGSDDVIKYASKVLSPLLLMINV